MSKVNKDAEKHLKDKIFNDDDWAEVTPVPKKLDSRVNKDIKKHLKDNVFEDEDWAEIIPPHTKSHNVPENLKDHRQLHHRDAPKQHPMSAIEGLVEELANKIGDDQVKVEVTSEGRILIIGSHEIKIYGDDEIIESISVNGKPIPIINNNVNISTDGLDISNSVITIETPESTTTVKISDIVKIILDELEHIKEDIPEIIFRTWPGMQGGH